MKSPRPLALAVLLVSLLQASRPQLLSAPPSPQVAAPARPAAPPGLSPSLTPPEILGLVSREIGEGRAAPAAQAFFVAMAYSFYDTRRSGTASPKKIFADFSARTLSALPPAQLAEFAAAGRAISSNPARLSSLLESAGRPSYGLEYLGKPAPRPPRDFDPRKSWEEIVSGLSKPGLMPR